MISVRNVTYTFETGDGGSVRAIDDVSIAFSAGEFVVLAGPNGAGKTTLIRHLNGLLSPDRGTVVVDGRPVAEDLVAARSAVGMVFQRPEDGFVAPTIRADVAFGPENLGLSRETIDRRVDRALEVVEMTGRGSERIDGLSGGEKRRVAIAGALAMEPSHLVLDEPFAGLDERGRRSVREHLIDLTAEGTGVIVVSHDLRGLLEPADRIVGMIDGRIAFDLPPERARDRLGAIDVHAPRSTIETE